MYKSIITLALSLNMPLALAQQSNETLTMQYVSKSSTPAAPVGKELPLKVTFDSYITVAGFSATTADTVVTAEAVATLGEHKVYANPSQTEPTVVKKNTVVRNLITGDFGIVTGNISVLTKDVVVLNAAALQLGLKPLKSLRNGQLQILQANSDVDLLEIVNKLRGLSGIKTVQLDVLDNRYTPQ
ncbi:MAG: hypothetical protein ACK4NN_16165 [Rheinheimera sp.]